jgi:HSP20 family protein
VAELTPTNWKRSIERLRRNVSHAFDRWFARLKGEELDEIEFGGPVSIDAMAYGIELDERDDELIARAALPGLGRNDLNVEVTKDRLVIRGGKRHSSRKKAQGYSRYEESFASFGQAVALPCEIDPKGVKARYKGGVLIVTLPKSEHAKSKRIKVPIG